LQALESNYCQKELAYISISDSSPVWEVMVAHRWKLLTLELASWIEDRWKQDQKKAQMKDYVHVSAVFLILWGKGSLWYHHVCVFLCAAYHNF
jgi:hypothetical protein